MFISPLRVLKFLYIQNLIYIYSIEYLLYIEVDVNTNLPSIPLIHFIYSLGSFILNVLDMGS
jgi:hypothetical protein